MTVRYRHLPAPAPAASRPWRLGMARGLRGHCPACGEGTLFGGYVRQREVCSRCGIDLLAYRADDAPAYFTILFVGHILVPAMLTVEFAYHPSTAVHLLLWLPFTALLSLALLPRIKGALIGLQWALQVSR